MRKVMIAIAVALVTAGTLFAADKTERANVLAAVTRLVDAFNKGDSNAVIAGGTDEMSIIDEFAPYEWHGAGTCAKWLADYDANAKKNGITDGVVTLGKTRHVDVDGDRAYVVVSTGYTWKEYGKAKKESAVWTLTLQKGKNGWLLTGWCWAKS